MTTTELLARCRDLGVDLAAGEDGALEWEADADPPADLLAALAHDKPAVLAVLRGMPCACGRPLDDKGRCWHCCDRRCVDCGRWTGSAFIQRCVLCGHALGGVAP